MSSPATTTAMPAEEAGFTHRQILVIMSGLMLGMFLAALDQTIVATALPTIVGDFHRSDLLSWVITAYLLASTASTPLWGKAGDLYGRKRVFQLAIVVFLVASALCGASQNMYQLIGFRGLQGIGGGGLIALVFAIIGDVIPPRERGRYQGYFGAVFGVASVVGPLIGGFAVDNLTWRFIFYINLPLGIVALIVTNRVLRLPARTRHVLIDWWGAILLVAGVSCILLATQIGGTDHPWGSWQVVGLFVLGAVGLAAFALREKMAPEPILPLELFRMQIFTVSNIVSFVSGIAMFGALAFLPQYLQLVHGVSATVSGLLLLPLLVGLLVMSISSGLFISRTGQYRWFPLAGTILVTIGLILLSQLGAHTSLVTVGLYILVFGAGLGLFIQVLTLVVQNAVPMRQMGVATSSVTFFRSMGGAIGASALGAILTAGIASELPKYLPASVLTGGGNGSSKVAEFVQSPAVVDRLKITHPAIHEGIIQAYSHAIDRMFLYAIPVSVLSVIAALFIKQVRLRTSNTAPEADGGPVSDGVPVGVGAPADVGSDGATGLRAPNGTGPDAAAGLDGAGTGTDGARVVTPEGTD
jgi:EmrB/QacA subfamily drug resistance transporter